MSQKTRSRLNVNKIAKRFYEARQTVSTDALIEVAGLLVDELPIDKLRRLNRRLRDPRLKNVPFQALGELLERWVRIELASDGMQDPPTPK